MPKFREYLKESNGGLPLKLKKLKIKKKYDGEVVSIIDFYSKGAEEFFDNWDDKEIKILRKYIENLDMVKMIDDIQFYKGQILPWEK